jgi:hypothetical protein
MIDGRVSGKHGEPDAPVRRGGMVASHPECARDGHVSSRRAPYRQGRSCCGQTGILPGERHAEHLAGTVSS